MNHNQVRLIVSKILKLPESVKFAKEMFPKPYVMPKWASEIDLWTVTALTSRNMLNAASDFAIGLVSNILPVFLKSGSRVYCVRPEVCEALMLTQLRGVTLSNMVFPVDSALFSLPKGLVKINNDTLELIAFAKLPAIGRRVEPHLGVTGMLSSGATIAANVPLSTEHTDTLPESMPFSNFSRSATLEARDEVAFLYSFAVKILAYLDVRQDFLSSTQTHERPDKKTQKQHGYPRDWWTPWIIGEKYVRSGSAPRPSGSHGHLAMHWRTGHFRMQRHGPALSLVKRIWIEPMLVGAGHE